MKRLLLLTTLLTFSISGFSQENNFRIQFKNSAEKISLICLDECSWGQLDYKINNITSKIYFNENGQTSKDNQDSAYLFSLEKLDNDTFKLEGIKNTKWIEYTFKTKGFWSNFTIDPEGMKSL